MADLTPSLNQLLTEKHAAKCIPSSESRRLPSTEAADEFLKEAYRINSHIYSLVHYLQSIRHSYLTTTPTPPPSHRQQQTQTHQRQRTSSLSNTKHQHLTDTQRDAIDSSTAVLLRDLSTSITNLASAEALREKTQATLLRKKYGSTDGLLWRWAGGGGATSKHETGEDKPEQRREEETARMTRVIREGVLWFLRRGLEGAMQMQTGMVERRIERVREKEKSVLYKSAAATATRPPQSQTQTQTQWQTKMQGDSSGIAHDAATMSHGEVAAIEEELSPEQLQLFAEENDSMLRHYEDTLNKVQNAEKSLLEIASLQQTLVSHLSTQEEFIGQLVTDAASTHTNIGHGNRELKRASDKRSTAQAVFWGTVGLCTWLVVWDLIF